MAAKPGIVSALTKHANGATDLTRGEKQVLLRDAAELIRTYRELVAFSRNYVAKATKFNLII